MRSSWRPVVAGVLSLAVVGSGCGPGADPATPDVGGYDLTVVPLPPGNADVAGQLYLGKIAIYASDIGTVTLGPEEEGNGQLVQVIFRVASSMQSDGTWIPVTTATMSTTAVRVGSDIDGRLYDMRPNEMTWADTKQGAECNVVRRLELGDDFIRGELCLFLDRSIVDPGYEPESLTVRGTFTALDP